ncbi:MAG: site-specific DNA-methyltransferase [Candidatus Poseidoniales archaeon]|jgi:site-specific DNA-methyltransferase (adenine-specific)
MIDLQVRDCLEYLSGIEDNSVDLVIVDPPYFEIIKDAWDNQWDSEEDYLNWCRQWTAECFRVLKPGKCFYVWGTTKQDTFLRYKLNVLNSMPDAHYQNWIIWAYDWGGRTKKKFPRKHEDLLMYSKGKEFPFYADEVRVPYKMAKSVRKGKELNALGKIPTDVWIKNNHTTSKEYAGWHSTQKPIKLLERIIKAHTQPGEIVLDCFSGSGSTMIAANNLGRSFMGCETDQEYCDKSLERLETLSVVR